MKKIDLVILRINKEWDFTVLQPEHFAKARSIASYAALGNRSARGLIRLGANGCVSTQCSEDVLLGCIQEFWLVEAIFAKRLSA